MIKLEQFIDQSLLRNDITGTEIEQLCSDARQYRFKAVIVNPNQVRRAAGLLQGSVVRCGAVCGFPSGAHAPEVKIYEAETAENAGAVEIDLVADIGAIKSGDFALLKTELSGVRKALAGDTVLKVILECSLLDDLAITTAAEIAADCGADFVKTSTGVFGQATTHHVTLLFQTVGSRIGVKAAGGIRDLRTALAMIEAGASRIGTSSGAGIMREFAARQTP